MHHNCHVIWSSRVPHWHMPTGRRTYTYTYTIFRERVRRYGIRVREWKIEDGGREKGGANFFHAKAACVRTHTRTTFVYLATAKLMERNATDGQTDGWISYFAPIHDDPLRLAPNSHRAKLARPRFCATLLKFPPFGPASAVLPLPMSH